MVCESVRPGLCNCRVVFGVDIQKSARTKQNAFKINQKQNLNRKFKTKFNTILKTRTWVSSKMIHLCVPVHDVVFVSSLAQDMHFQPHQLHTTVIVEALHYQRYLIHNR